MRNRLVRLLLLSALAGVATPALACRVHNPAEMADLAEADVILWGRISTYAIVPNEPNPGKHARFDILVDDVLKGTATDRVTATWDNSTFGLPETMPAGPFLIALRHPGSKTISGNAARGVFTVLQRPCAEAFLFARGSAQAAAAAKSIGR